MLGPGRTRLDQAEVCEMEDTPGSAVAFGREATGLGPRVGGFLQQGRPCLCVRAAPTPSQLSEPSVLGLCRGPASSQRQWTAPSRGAEPTSLASVLL